MIKPGVDVRGLKPQMVLAYTMAQAVFHRKGYDCIITSGADGKHMPGSLHPVGMALDLRTRHVLRSDLSTLYTDIRTALGEQFDVVLEKDHLHIEFDPHEPEINPEER